MKILDLDSLTPVQLRAVTRVSESADSLAAIAHDIGISSRALNLALGRAYRKLEVWGGRWDLVISYWFTVVSRREKRARESAALHRAMLKSARGRGWKMSKPGRSRRRAARG